MFYDGNPQLEPGAVVCRVAPSFTRFGNFQILMSRGDTETLRKLADHTIRYDFPHLGSPTPEVYAQWFHEICASTAKMIVHWMRVGFVHGVMNTDNMSILGLTIDYGPYGWLENYDPDWTPNTTDARGRRYRYGHQPQIAQWNLMQLANGIAPLFDGTEELQKGLEIYVNEFEKGWDQMMTSKLGLQNYDPKTDPDLFRDLFALLQQAETDMTIFFRRLADVDCETSGDDVDQARLLQPLQEAYYMTDQLTADILTQTSDWITTYRKRVQREATPNPVRRTNMNRVNPKYVLRNYLAQLAIDQSEKGDHAMISDLLDLSLIHI